MSSLAPKNGNLSQNQLRTKNHQEVLRKALKLGLLINALLESVKGILMKSLFGRNKPKSKSQNVDNKKTKTPNFPKNEHCAYQEVRNVRFSEKMECFVFMLPPS